MKRILLNTKISKIYILGTILISLLLLGSYFSYAMFTVTKEKSNAISIITGTLSYDLKVDDVSTDKLVIGPKESKTFTVTLSNPNNRVARFNFYYLGALPVGVNVGWLEESGYDLLPEEIGINVAESDVNSYKIIVSNATDSNFTLTLGVEVGLDYNDLTLPDNGNLFIKINKILATTLVKNKSNSENSIYEDLPEAEQKEPFIYTHVATEQTAALIDYRYVGLNPNNYILFNNELWRIIGSFSVDDGNGNMEERLKIVRATSLNDYYSWDNKNQETGALTDYGKNNWTDARLNYLLNEDHENEEIGGSLYWNSGEGLCYKGQNNATAACSFVDMGMKDESKTMVSNALWYLGGSSTNSGVNADDWYNYERSTNVYNVEYSNPLNWIGKVGLIYPSDYAYASGGGDNTTRSECLAMDVLSWRNYSDCYMNNWLHDSVAWNWTITPSSSISSRVYRVSKYGEVNSEVGAYDFIHVHPVVYLKKDLNIIFGVGSEDDPYILYF